MIEIIEELLNNPIIIYQIVLIFICFFIFYIIYRLIKRFLLKKVKTKKQISNVYAFLDLIKYSIFFFLIIFIIMVYFGSVSELGYIAGLISVALGLALQKPISGIVAWLIITIRRPFDIGDRILISNIKGDLTNISLTHFYLDEVGGTIEGEEKSGRTVMIPTSIIFEKEIVNYTHEDEFILVEITTNITYESNLEKAEKIILESVSKIMESYWGLFPKNIKKEPHIRLQFRDSGIEVIVRYYTLALKRNFIATNIRREIFNQIRQAPDVEFAYPHAEVLLREKNKQYPATK